MTPNTSTESFFCRMVPTPYRVSSLLNLDSLQPNTKLVTVAVSRNIPESRLVDLALHYTLSSDGPELRYTLHAITPTTTDWLLTLISLADHNQDVRQSHTPNLPNFE